MVTSRRWLKRVSLSSLLAVSSSFTTRRTSKINVAARLEETIRSLLTAGLTVVTRVEITTNCDISAINQNLSNA